MLLGLADVQTKSTENKRVGCESQGCQGDGSSTMVRWPPGLFHTGDAA